MGYDAAGAFEDIEMALIKSMRRNMQRHIKEEYDEGINWTQWQAEMLAGLQQYKAENADAIKGYCSTINDQINAAIREAYATGESELEIEILERLRDGYKPPKDGDQDMQGAFFRTNAKKLNALIQATTDDMEKAETAMLRMTDDVYRQTLFKAQMFYNTGAGNMWQCVDMATKDFLNAGINCVQYRNGARVNIASYAEMALRTANKRANLMGQANTREKYAIHTVKVNARGTACPMCLQWLGKVYIDDVYGGGTAEESRKTGYPLLSSAVAGGLYHPNCKDSCSTFYVGINRPAKELTQGEKDEACRRYNLEQKQRYYERNYKRNLRLGNGCLDQQAAKVYFERAGICKENLLQLCDDNPDVLRLDKARLSLRGVLSVDNAGRITYKKPAAPKPPDKRVQKVLDGLDRAGVKNRVVTMHEKAYDEPKIIQTLAGGDRTKGSCASVGLAYMGQKGGVDVRDFRGGKSQRFFSVLSNLKDISNFPGAKTIRASAKSTIEAGDKLLQKVKKGKEYYFVAGRHAAIVRRTDDALQYLELQSATQSGWTNFDSNPCYTLDDRFGCTSRSHSADLEAFMIDVDSLKDSDDLKAILGYINTTEKAQRKGINGRTR